MHVHCLGTTGYHPSPTRHTACYYLPELGLVLDAGTGMFRLVEHLLKHPRQRLDILLSHAHLDHIVGLTFLLDAMAVTELKTIRLIGERAKLEAIRQHIYSPLIFPVEPPFEFTALEASTGMFELANSRIHYFPLEHPGGSVGYVVETADRRMAYVTDTVALPEAGYLRELADLDLLLHECYFNDASQALAIKTGHSWLSGVTDVVRSIRPRRTGLIHINPLAEVLGDRFELDAQHTALGMFLTEDEQAIEI